jgi:hypothetical protein
MENREQFRVDEACAVPYRLSHLGVEFCLVSEVKVNRWEFPKISNQGGQFSANELLAQVVAAAGAGGQLNVDKPLAQFASARKGAARCTSAYLMHVTLVDDKWPQQAGRRRLWCLAEEARARLRRKPLRRLIDLALHSLKTDESDAPSGRPRTPK